MSERSIRRELRAGGCTEEEIELLLLVERTARRRERVRRGGLVTWALARLAALAPSPGR